MKIVTIISGGMDSTVLAWQLAKEGYEQLFLSFDYGQRHKKELEFAASTAKTLHCDHQIISLTDITRFLSTSALTGNVPVPDGHYNENSMRATVVPNRNPIMLSIACGIASSKNIPEVAIGVHTGDRYNYPDCRPGFILQFNSMEVAALDGFTTPCVYAPFIELSKAQIASIGKEIGLDFSTSWSCYKGGKIHCGRCGTCVERIEALHEAGVKDTTKYEDSEFWKKAVKDYNAVSK
jgi:7-cyano-7-deazaguanine synthase